MSAIIRQTALLLCITCLPLAAMEGAALAQGRPQTAPPMAAPPTATPPAAAPAGTPPAQAAAAQPPLKQIALTDKQIEDSLAANAEIGPIVDKLPEDAAPDPKVIAQLDAIAKKHSFASFADYDSVTANINLVMSGFDPDTKKFVGQEAVLKKELATVQADKKMAPKDKKEAIDELGDALKMVQPLQFPGNATVVAKYYDKLSAMMGQDQQ